MVGCVLSQFNILSCKKASASTFFTAKNVEFLELYPILKTFGILSTISVAHQSLFNNSPSAFNALFTPLCRPLTLSHQTSVYIHRPLLLTCHLLEHPVALNALSLPFNISYKCIVVILKRNNPFSLAICVKSR